MGATTGPVKSNKGTVIFLHGAPTQSYSYRVVLAQVYIGHTHFWRLWNFVYLKGSAVFRAISVKWKVRCYCYTWLCYLCNFLELCVWNRWQRLGITAMHLTGLVLDSVRNHNLIMTFLTQVHITIFQPLNIQWHWVWTFVFSSSLLCYVETELF